MRLIAAANLFENPLVLVAILLFGALSSWLMKRRGQAADEAAPNENESPPPLGEQGRSTRASDWQDLLRQLVGGEPLVLEPPTIPRASRCEEPMSVQQHEEPLHPGRIWPDESEEPDEGLRQPWNHALERSTQHTAVAATRAARVEADDRLENPVRHGVALVGPTQQSGRTRRPSHKAPVRARAGAVHLWRDPRLVRQAFVASLIFAPPKSLRRDD